MITLVAMTDGRGEYLEQTVASFDEMVGPSDLVTRRVLHNDCPDPEYGKWLFDRFPGFEVIPSWKALQGMRSGFGGAIRSAWAYLRAFPGTEQYVFWLEEDFTFNRPVDLDLISTVLVSHPHIAQMALRRQAWNQEEAEAGGVVELRPFDYSENQMLLTGEPAVVEWLEHRLFFSTNPSLFRMSLIRDRQWPEAEHSEGVFSIETFADGVTRSAYWGARDSGEWVTHIGHNRTGTGY